MKKSLLGSLVIFSMCLLNMGCPSSSTTPSAGTTTATPTPAPGGGNTGPVALTAAQIAGNHSICVPITNDDFGTDLNGDSFYRYLSINADGTYSLDTFLFTGTTCLGGNEIFLYSQIGTFTMGTLTTSGATEILYTASSSSLTIYNGGAGASLWAALPGSTCTSDVGSSGFYTQVGSGANETESNDSIAGGHCTSAGLEIAFPDNTQFYDLVSLDSTASPTTFTVSEGNQNDFYMGQYSSYPTTATSAWTF